MIMRFLLLLLVLPVLVTGQNSFTPEDYIEKYRDMAIEEMHRSGVPASITLAQGILESGSGNSQLAVNAKNHFGIKCHKGWDGKTYYVKDDDYDEEGNLMKSCFRSYNSVAESFADHSEFLKTRSRYDFLFELRSNDYKGWAHGLKRAGYATNPEYGNILIRIIERYELYQYDTHTKKRIFKPDIPDIFEINNTDAIAYDGEMSIRELRDEYYFGRWQIYKYNDIEKGEPLKKGMVLYLKPKRRKNEVVSRHVVQEGENMQYISQLRGIKLRRLYKLNQLEKGQEPAVGEILYLDERRESTPQLAQEPVTDLVYFTVESEMKNPENIENPPLDEIVAEKKPIEREDGLYHKVAPGETLMSIARAYELNWQSLKAQNNLTSNELRVGQELLIEPRAELAIADNNEGSSQEANTDENGSDAPILLDEAAETYKVKKGDSLFGIARLNGLSVAELMDINDLEEPAIQEGQVLRVR